MYLRGSVDAEDDPRDGGDVLLTVRLSVDDSLEPDWSVVKNSKEPKKINAKQRALFGVHALGGDCAKDLSWGRQSVLHRYANSKGATEDARVQALRKLAGSLSKSNTTCIFINQLREKIGVMFGNPETTTGGRALKFFSSVRIDIRRVESIKVSGEIVGNRVRAKVVKNKVAPPFRQVEFDLMYGTGISKEGCILDMAVEAGVAIKSGAWYTYEETRLGQGREAAKQTLAENPEMRDEIERKVREKFGIPIIERSAEDAEVLMPVEKPKKK